MTRRSVGPAALGLVIVSALFVAPVFLLESCSTLRTIRDALDSVAASAEGASVGDVAKDVEQLLGDIRSLRRLEERSSELALLAYVALGLQNLVATGAICYFATRRLARWAEAPAASP